MKFGFCVVLAVGFQLGGCKKPSGPPPGGPPAVPVEVAVAERRVVPVEMKAIGTVEPIASVRIKSKVPGEILEVQFADGARVTAGDSLFRIDARSYEAALKRAQANLTSSETTARNASEQADRYTTLIQRGVASKEQTAQFLTTAASQQAEIAARQADLEEARLLLEWTRIVAPISGRIGEALLKAGNLVKANEDTLAVINQMQPITVAFPLPENVLATVRHWMAKGPPTVTVYEPDTGRELGTGTLSFVDNAVDRASGMILFKAVFSNAEEALWPGQFVDVTVRLTEEPDALVIPVTAVMEGQKGQQVYVVKDGIATLRTVGVERTVGERAVIQSGLEPGERVITTGQLRVSAGGKVDVKGKAAGRAE